MRSYNKVLIADVKSFIGAQVALRTRPQVLILMTRRATCFGKSNKTRIRNTKDFFMTVSPELKTNTMQLRFS